MTASSFSVVAAFGRVAGHPSGMLRQVVVDRPPRRLGGGEDMKAWADAGIAVEQARRHAHRIEIGRLAWHQRAAGRAERAEAAGCGLVAPDRLLAAQPAELGLLDMGVGGEAR